MNNKAKSKKYRSFGSIRSKSGNKFPPDYRYRGERYYREQCGIKTDADDWLARVQFLISEGRWTEPGQPDRKNWAAERFRTVGPLKLRDPLKVGSSVNASRRRFSQEFKDELCREVFSTSRPIREVADPYGVLT